MSTEIATGREAELKNAGYKPLPVEKDPDEGGTVRDEADKRAKPTEAVLTRSLDLPDNTALTMQQAGEALSALRSADAKAAEIEADDKLIQKVEKDRGETEEAPKAEKAAPPESDEHVEKLIRKHPKIRDALLQEAAENDAVRTQFKQATDTALNFGRESVLAAFPELAQLPPTQEAWIRGLAQMAQREPHRYQQAASMINRVDTLEKAQAQSSARGAAEFQTWAKAEDARYHDVMKGEKNRAAIEKQVAKTLKDAGVDMTGFFKAATTENRFLRSAEAQLIMVKAAKWDLHVKGQEAARNAPRPKAAPQPVPSVVRPGTAQPRVNPQVADLRTLSGKLDRTGSLADAVKLYAARGKGSR